MVEEVDVSREGTDGPDNLNGDEDRDASEGGGGGGGGGGGPGRLALPKLADDRSDDVLRRTKQASLNWESEHDRICKPNVPIFLSS